MSGIVAVVVVHPGEPDPGARAAEGSQPPDASPSPVWVMRALGGHGGEVTEEPEGVVALFGSASGAVTASVAVQQAGATGRHGTAGPRIGIELTETEGDPRRSAAAATARRLASAARAGQILTSAVVAGLVSATGDHELDPVEVADADAGAPVFSVLWEPAEAGPGLRVVVADDAPLIRTGLVRLLEAAGFVVTAEAGDLDELRAAVAASPPDLVVTDIRMPPTNTDEGLRAATEIRAGEPDVGVLVLSQHVEARAAAGLLDGRPGGLGYLLKERVGDLEEFTEACRTVASGGSVIDPIVTEQLMRRRHDGVDRLSEREADVLGLMAQGRSNTAIAEQLHVGSKTVETHIRSIFQKLDIADSPEGNRRVRAVLEWLGR